MGRSGKGTFSARIERLEDRRLLSAVMVKDINHQSDGIEDFDDWLPPVQIGQTIFFKANDGIHGDELWRTDGTSAGTHLVKDINPGSDYSDIFSFFAVGDLLFFSAVDDTHFNQQLWRSDGTEEGTFRLTDMGNSYFAASPYYMTEFKGLFFFTVSDGPHGYELWRSDGTVAGTYMVKDIFSGSASGYPSSYSVLGDWLYFAATDEEGGTELWRTDGSAEGTSRFLDVIEGPEGSYPDSLIAFDDALYFSTSDADATQYMWRSDGTAEGTLLLQSFPATDRHAFVYNPVEFRGELYFHVSDGSWSNKLWKTDGTVDGTLLVADTGMESPEGQYGTQLVSGDYLYFTAMDGDTDVDALWRTDGTTQGTVKLRGPDDWGTENDEYAVESLLEINGKVYFTITDGFDGAGIWTTDGSVAGTVKALAFDQLKNMSATDSGMMVFAANGHTSHGVELWFSDGTEAGSYEIDINRLPLPYTPGNLTPFQDGVLFGAGDGDTGVELYKSDGTDAGTSLVRDVEPGEETSFPSQFVAAGEALFFTVFDQTRHRQLWRTDGTEAGTKPVIFDPAHAHYDFIFNMTAGRPATGERQ